MGIELVKKTGSISLTASNNVDLSNYYTKPEIDEKLENVTVDLTGYATEDYVNNAVHNIPQPDLSNYYTKGETDAAINVAVSEIDLSGYALKSEIPDVSGFISEIPSEYVTESELNAKGYLTEHQSLEGYALKTDIPDVSGFALKSEIPSIEGLATETYVNEKIAAIPEVDLSGYALKSEIPDVSNLATKNELDIAIARVIGEIPDVSGYQTEAQVIALIEAHGGGGGSLPVSEEVGF